MVASMREYFPGPVTPFTKTFRRLIRDADAVRTRAVVKAMDFRGRRVADAMRR